MREHVLALLSQRKPGRRQIRFQTSRRYRHRLLFQSAGGGVQPKPVQGVHGVGDAASRIDRLHGQSQRAGQETPVPGGGYPARIPRETRNDGHLRGIRAGIERPGQLQHRLLGLRPRHRLRVLHSGRFQSAQTRHPHLGKFLLFSLFSFIRVTIQYLIINYQKLIILLNN